MTLGILEGAAVALVFYLIGRYGRRGKGLRKPPNPVCGCRHHHSMHDPETGHCHALVDGPPVKYNGYQEPTAWAQVQCPCRRYSGPEPLPEYYAPEISS